MQFMYPRLRDYFECISGPYIHAWWKYVDKHPSMNIYARALMAILMGGQPKGIQCNFNNNACKLCISGAIESPAHVLFACPALQATRNDTWTRLLRIMPAAMAESMRNSNDMEKVKQFYSCYGGNYIQEWDEVYANTVKMVYEMYSARYTSYKLLDTL